MKHVAVILAIAAFLLIGQSVIRGARADHPAWSTWKNFE